MAPLVAYALILLGCVAWVLLTWAPDWWSRRRRAR
jgi:hypothetical protein